MLITGGLGSFTARPLPAADSFTGTGIAFFVKQLDELAGHDVVIVGGGDSAFDWALALSPIAKSVCLVHRRDKFRAHAGDRGQSAGAAGRDHRQRRGHPHPRRQLRHGRRGAVRGAEPRAAARQTPSSQRSASPPTSARSPTGASTLDRRHIVVDSTTATNLPARLRRRRHHRVPRQGALIATGFGEAATAVNNAAVAIDPAAHLFPGHSSDGT